MSPDGQNGKLMKTVAVNVVDGGNQRKIMKIFFTSLRN